MLDNRRMAPTAAIGIICKTPRPGTAKTRLAAAIGAEAAATAAACFLRDIAASIERIPPHLGGKGYAVYAPAGTEAELRALLPTSFGLLLQSHASLGDVLFSATRELLAEGHDCVVLVNGDSPTLPERFMSEAIERLHRDGDRLVLGPASDGGYYLIGLKQPHRMVFSDIPWSTEAVTRATLERAAAARLECALLPEWYDVDDAETFGWLREELAGQSRRFTGGAVAASTRAWLAASGSSKP